MVSGGYHPFVRFQLRRFDLVLGGIVIALGVSAVWSSAAHPDVIDPGPWSEFRRTELLRISERVLDDPLMLPQHLPPGAAAANGDGFALIDSYGQRRGAWVSSYIVDALPPARGDDTGYLVYQDRRGSLNTTSHRRCSGRDGPGPRVVRPVGDDQVVICLGPNPTAEARTYWRTVPFTDDLDAIEWLVD
jgi:hypothetical protein